MATLGQDADAAFFSLMHHFLAASQKGEGDADQDEPEAERRCKLRRAFRLAQAIAPGYGWEMPPDSAWIDVRCHDLTQCGFSFFLDEKPAFERLVARFGTAEPIYVAARVNNWRPVLVDGSGNILEPGTLSTGCHTEPKVLVGCQLLRRFADESRPGAFRLANRAVVDLPTIAHFPLSVRIGR